jgi:alpha-ketoglutarate-dependent taurine dioxygenase
MADLEIRNLCPEFGVEVSGLEPRIPLDDRTCRLLRDLFDERGLLLFRELDADLAFQTYLSQMLIGQEKQSADSAASAPMPEFYVSNKEPGGGAPFGRLLYHSDLMWVENACQLLSLYGVEVSEPSTPTMFASATHAWDTLPEDLRARVQGRFAEHCPDATYQKRAGGDSDVLVSTFETEERVKLPVGYRHPRTGRTILYVCQQMTHGIADLSPEESEKLLEALFEHLYAPGKVLEHHWRKGDLVLWDNLAVQHARPNVSVEGPARTLRKVFAPAPNIPHSDRPQFSRVGAGS